MYTLRYWSIVLLLLFSFSFQGCEDLFVEPDKGGYNCSNGNCISVNKNADYTTLADCNSKCNSGNTSGIYYRIQVDLSYPAGNGATSCHITPGNYTDNNDAVPDYASFDTFYGPCQPGTYNASFVWNTTASTPTYINYSYTLEKPASGYNRYYTHLLIKYYPGTNRCQASAVTSTDLVYYDEKQ